LGKRKVPKRTRTKDPEIFQIGEAFYFRGTVDKRREEIRLDAETYFQAKEAKRILLQKIEEKGGSGHKLLASTIFPDYIADREEEFRLEDIRESTLIECRSLIGLHLKPYFGRYKLSEIDDDLWTKYLRAKKDMDPTNHRKVLAHFLKWCKKKKYIKFLPELELKKRKRKARINLTEQEITQFLTEVFKHRGGTPLIILMALTMGLRGGEITNAEWTRIDFENDAYTLEEEDTKTGKPRVVPLNSLVKELLVKRKATSKSKWVFPNQRSILRPMSDGGYGDQFERIRVASGLKRDFTLHDLRATIEGLAVVDTRFTDAQREKMFGSSSKVQKDIYAKLTVDQLRGLEELIKVPQLAGLNWGSDGEKKPSKNNKEGSNV